MKHRASESVSTDPHPSLMWFTLSVTSFHIQLEFMYMVTKWHFMRLEKAPKQIGIEWFLKWDAVMRVGLATAASLTFEGSRMPQRSIWSNEKHLFVFVHVSVCVCTCVSWGT